jgi:5-methylcytosine-specific restriction protein A
MVEHGRICHVCGLPLADEVDHVIPLAEGGADDESNLRPIHSLPCHRDKTLDEGRRARLNM